MNSEQPSEQELLACVSVMERLVADRTGLATLDLATRNRLLMAAGRLSRPERDEQRLLSRALKKQTKRRLRDEDAVQLERAQIRKLRAQPVFITPERELAGAVEGRSYDRNASPAGPPDTSDSAEAAPPLNNPRACYVCKRLCRQVHFFYDQMCDRCGDFNHAKRTQTADLRGRTALITGARVKIGYQAAILLLRAGARVLVTTRFPRDAAARFAREADFLDWKQRLKIFGLDLRHTPSVEAFARHIQRSEQRLDFMLHNACQTVRRPPGFYQHLMAAELVPLSQLAAVERELVADYEALRKDLSLQLGGGTNSQTRPLELGLGAPAALSQVALVDEDRAASHALFPSGQLDADLQQLDLRNVNSWRLPLDQVSTVELLEVQLVNAVAPFVLNARLRSLMARERTFDKHIVNVSAMEGQFYRRYKTDKHPHTNMAKAALNMMTRTSASDYAKDGIFMNSVDTGWVTDENPAHIAERKREDNGFHPPLDIVDGAARIVDPIFSGFNTSQHVYGQFLKDYRATTW